MVTTMHIRDDEATDSAGGCIIRGNKFLTLVPGAHLGPYEILSPLGPAAWATSTRRPT
jgi:hypothetical protein